MITIDVNVLVYAFDEDAVAHDRYLDWLTDALAGDEPVGMTDVVLSGFVRVVTHPRILVHPAPIETALGFVDALRAAPAVVPVLPSDGRWSIFERLCRAVGAKGNLVADAFVAASAIDLGAELVTTDGDFSRFPGLRWRHPLGDRLGQLQPALPE